MSELKLTAEEARDIISGDHDDFKVITDKILENSRWSILHLVTIQRISDGLFFQDSYSEGATEQQDESPWEYTEPAFYEVVATPVTVTKYVRKNSPEKPVPVPVPSA